MSSKKAPVRQEAVKNQTKSKVAVKSSKKDKVKAEAVAAQKKPDDFDDGSWFTVPTKSEKKKPKLEDVTSSPKAESLRIEQSIVEKKNAKNSKQLKDQANKSKKEAEDAAATKVLKVETVTDVPVITEAVLPKTKSIVLNEEDKQTAEIIEKIHEAIVDVVIEPVVVQKQIVSNSISKKIVADREEKVDDIKPVETNVAFDELAGIFIGFFFHFGTTQLSSISSKLRIHSDVCISLQWQNFYFSIEIPMWSRNYIKPLHLLFLEF